MSDKQKHPHAQALQVAREIERLLTNACDRIAIAGSLRRQKPTVGDVELLFVPKTVREPDGLFDFKTVSVAEAVLNAMLKDGYLAKRPNKKGVFAWGPDNKLAIHVPSGIPVDLFTTTEENFNVALVIRTGGKDTNLLLTTGANKLGRTLNAYGCGVTDRATGQVTRATSERHVFELCGVPYREPKDRQ